MPADQPLILSPGSAASASPEEAAAIVAALERFMRDTASARNISAPPPDAWHAAAVLEGVSRDPWAAATDAWLATPG
jgi:hypothetical protein